MFTAITDAQYGYVNYLKIIEGMVVQAHTVEIKKKLDETESELLEVAIPEIRAMFSTESPEIYASHEVDLALLNVKVSVPQRGDKMRLINYRS